MTDRTWLVLNPVSGGGRAQALWLRYESVLREAIGPLEFHPTRRAGHGFELARAAAAAGVRTVYVLGGDGIFSEVISGLVESEADVDVALLPGGSGSDLARGLGLPPDLPAALQLARETQARATDVGRLRLRRPDGGEAALAFANVASCGLSAYVDRAVNASNKPLGGRVAYAQATLGAFWRFADGPVRVEVDDELVHQGEAWLVAVCNGRYFGAGMCIAPQALADDGLLDVVVLERRGALASLASSWRIYGGRHLGRPGVRAFRGRRALVEPLDGARPMGLDVDGETPGMIPAEFECLAGAVRIHRPPQPKAQPA